MKASRIAALVAAAFLIPACGGDDDDEGDVELTIVNAGPTPVHAEVSFFDKNEDMFVTEEFDLGPGTSRLLRIWELQADVFITRVSDGAVLFDDTLEFQDFTDQRATVTVTP